MSATLPAPQSRWMFGGEGKHRPEEMTVVFSADKEIIAVGKSGEWMGDADLFDKQFDAI